MDDIDVGVRRVVKIDVFVFFWLRECTGLMVFEFGGVVWSDWM